MTLLLVDDDDTFRFLLAAELRRAGHLIVEARTAAEAVAQAHAVDPDVVLLDLSLPDGSGIEVLKRLRAERSRAEVVVLTAHGTVDTAVAALKLGAFEYLQKPCPLEALKIAVTRANERREIGEENACLKDGLTPPLAPEFVGRGPAFDELHRFVAKVANSDAAVLIRGETGTGKELVATTVHRLSPRRDQPFVVVDCAALNENLLQSELFGHERGAFTGAVKQRHGLFEAANGGTIFLDEVGDVSPAVQAGLLRVLETSTFRRLGGTRELTVDVRLIAATNRDLERLMAANAFRRDLYFRLSTIQCELPPLRQRPDEIPMLVEHFAARHNARRGSARCFSSAAMALLKEYGWPGNVRELRHVVERALILAEGEAIGPEDLPGQVRCRPLAAGQPEEERGASLAVIERQYIHRVLREVGGHRARAAEILGISERNLYRKIREHELEEGDEPSGEHAGRPDRP